MYCIQYVLLVELLRIWLVSLWPCRFVIYLCIYGVQSPLGISHLCGVRKISRAPGLIKSARFFQGLGCWCRESERCRVILWLFMFSSWYIPVGIVRFLPNHIIYMFLFVAWVYLLASHMWDAKLITSTYQILSGIYAVPSDAIFYQPDLRIEPNCCVLRQFNTVCRTAQALWVYVKDL